MGGVEGGAPQEATPDPEPRSRVAAAMDPEQARVFEELITVHPDLARYYYGAVIALSDSSNPEAPYQAAHSLRELMEKLPKYRDVDVAGGVGQIKLAAESVQAWWADRKARGLKCEDGHCEVADGTLAGALDGLDAVLVGSLTRSQEAEAAMRTFDPAGADVDTAILKAWRRLRGKLSDLSHHSDTVPPESAPELLARFGDIFLSLAVPAPSDDLSLLDDIMREVEGTDG